MRSPLKYGDVIYPSAASDARVLEKVMPKMAHADRLDQQGATVDADRARLAANRLAVGLLTEYAHNDAFEKAGLHYELTATTNVYDRIVDDVWQDDKLATRNDAGELSGTHTISSAEMEAWLRQPDVIIHSFEETLDGGSLYRGWISFRLLVERELLVQSKYDNTFFFARINALICTRIVNDEPTDDLYNRVER